jgi:hypothetical protein
MADEPVAENLGEQPEEEEEGGPIKSFLEHLEDLRWVLIKSGVAAGVAMLGCLLAGNYVVQILEWPLTQAPARHSTKTQTVRVLLGTNQLSVLQVTTNDSLSSLVGTNPLVRLELLPMIQGTNQVMAWRVLDDSDRPASRGLPIDIRNYSPAGAGLPVHLLLCRPLRLPGTEDSGEEVHLPRAVFRGWAVYPGCLFLLFHPDARGIGGLGAVRGVARL